MIVCTSICANYIPKAKLLAHSLKRQHPEALFVLGLAERSIPPAAQNQKEFDLVITASELGIENFESFMFKHSIVEASTAVKGHLLGEILRRFPQEREFIYLDPDIWVLGPLVELQEALSHHDIVLTPHLCEPEDNFQAIMENEICALQHGVFNLGFLAIRRSEEAKRFLNWWSERLKEFCYARKDQGLFTDQKWVDLAPCFFEVFIFKHPGYNAAPWNISRRTITENASGEWLVGNQPLRFFHFSGLDSGANEYMISRYCPDESKAIFKMRDQYLELLEKFGQSEMGNLPWSYDFYSNGEKIKNCHRALYRADVRLQTRFKEPFNADDTSSFFHRVIKVPHLLRQLQKVGEAYKTGGIGLVVKKTWQYINSKKNSWKTFNNPGFFR